MVDWRLRAFYGWYVVYAVGFVLMTTSGLAFYNLSVLLDAFVAERGFPVALTSGATASFFIASGAGGVFAGRLMDRIDARLIMIFGACVSAIALGSLSLLQRPWQLYAFHLVYGFCYGFCGLVPATTIVARWFEARRALALSIASTGLSLGGVLITPLCAFLIQRWGIAGAAPWLGLTFFLGVVPVTAAVVRSSPQEMGLVPDGSKFAQRGSSIALPRNVSYAQARRSRFFLGVTAAYLFGLGAQVGAITHLFRLASTRESPGIAALALALLASASVVGPAHRRLAAAQAADPRVRGRHAAGASAGARAARVRGQEPASGGRRAVRHHGGQRADAAAAAARRGLRHAPLWPHLFGVEPHHGGGRGGRPGADRGDL